jgi:hypothetical protein
MDLKKLNYEDSQKLLELALRKYSTFAKEVAKAIKTSESRMDSIRSVTDELISEVNDVIDSYHSRYPKTFDAYIKTELSDVFQRIRVTVDSSTPNEVYEIAFKALLRCWSNITHALHKTYQDNDWLGCIDEAKNVAKDMALEWSRKDGKINKDMLEMIFRLLGNYIHGSACDALKKELRHQYFDEGFESASDSDR